MNHIEPGFYDAAPRIHELSHDFLDVLGGHFPWSGYRVEVFTANHRWRDGLPLRHIGRCLSSAHVQFEPDLSSFRMNSLRHPDRKSTRLNSSHSSISYAVFCLKKKKKKKKIIN